MQRPVEESRGLALRSFRDNSLNTDLTLRSLTKIDLLLYYRNLLQIALPRDLAQQLLQRTSQGDLAQSSTEIFTEGTCRI